MGGFGGDWAIFLSPHKGEASHYAGSDGVVLEVEVPTKFLVFMDGYDNHIGGIKDYLDNGYQSPRQYQERWGNPEAKYTKTFEGSKFPVLPLKYVNGVMDQNITGRDHFFPLEMWANNFYKRNSDKVPQPEKWNLRKVNTKILNYSFNREEKEGRTIDIESIEEEKQKIERWEDNIGHLSYSATGITRTLSSPSKKKRNLISSLRDFNVELEEYVQKLEEETGQSFEEPNKIKYESLIDNKFEEQMKFIINELPQKLEKEAERLYDVAETGNEDKLEEINHRVNQLIVSVLKKCNLIVFDQESINYVVSNTDISKEDKRKMRDSLASQLQ